MDNRGASSESVAAGTVSVVLPPSVSAINVGSGRVQLVGRGVPGTKLALSIADVGSKAGARKLRNQLGTTGPSGDFTLSTGELAQGTYELQLTQEDGSGVSDPLTLGPVTVMRDGLPVAPIPSTIPEPTSTLALAEPTTLSSTSSESATEISTSASRTTFTKSSSSGTETATGLVNWTLVGETQIQTWTPTTGTFSTTTWEGSSSSTSVTQTTSSNSKTTAGCIWRRLI